MVFFRRKKPQTESIGATPTPPSEVSPAIDSHESQAPHTPSQDRDQDARAEQKLAQQQRPRRLNPLAMQDPRDIPGNIVSTLRRDQPQRPARSESD